MLEFILYADRAILDWVQQTLRCTVLDFIMPLITHLGDGGFIWFAAALVLILTRRYRRVGVLIIIGVIVGFLIGNVCLKQIFARARPFADRPDFLLSVAPPQDYSFPSGHTLSSVIAAVTLTLGNRKFGYVAIPLTLLIAFSRIYLYLHFPTDVLTSLLLGIAIAFAVFYIAKRIYPDKMQNRISK